MEAYGIKYDDIKVQYLSFGEAASALKDGNVDAAFVTAGHPTAAIQDIATQNDVVLVPVDADKADALIKNIRSTPSWLSKPVLIRSRMLTLPQ